MQKAGWWLSVHVVGAALVGAAFLKDTPRLPESSLMFIKASRYTCLLHTVWAFPSVTEKNGKLKGSWNRKTH